MTQAELVVDDAVTDRTRLRHADDGHLRHRRRPAHHDDRGTHQHGAVRDARADAGKHTVFVRALDSAGNWGVVGSAILNLPKTGPQTTNGSARGRPGQRAARTSTVSATGDDRGAGGTITDCGVLPRHRRRQRHRRRR